MKMILLKNKKLSSSKIDINYLEVQNEDYSKSRKNQGSIKYFKNIISQTNLLNYITNLTGWVVL